MRSSQWHLLADRLHDSHRAHLSRRAKCVVKKNHGELIKHFIMGFSIFNSDIIYIFLICIYIVDYSGI